MLTIAYLANEFPSAVEPYVSEEISELRRRGVRVITASVRNPRSAGLEDAPEIVVQTSDLFLLARAIWFLLMRWHAIAPVIHRIVLHGREGLLQRLKAVLHTFLGACYAVRLSGRSVDHIQVHHGYFGSWIAMTAARLLDVEFSMTLHGSDLLLHGTYLDVKLANCGSCFTISEYNRGYILEHCPTVDPQKVIVTRLGADLAVAPYVTSRKMRSNVAPFTVVTVGRLHEVKDHAFLVRACRRLKDAGIHVECFIGGDGPERHNLARLIRKLGMEQEVTLLGHVPRHQTASLYDRADVVVLTSRSEGLPLVLMEAMARGRIVLAPAITGIPELVVPGKTGFLYQPDSMDDFVHRLSLIYSLLRAEGRSVPRAFGGRVPLHKTLNWVRYGAYLQVLHNFNRGKNLESFADLFLRRISPPAESVPDENLVLQQI